MGLVCKSSNHERPDNSHDREKRTDASLPSALQAEAVVDRNSDVLFASEVFRPYLVPNVRL